MATRSPHFLAADSSTSPIVSAASPGRALARDSVADINVGPPEYPLAWCARRLPRDGSVSRKLLPRQQRRTPIRLSVPRRPMTAPPRQSLATGTEIDQA